MDEEEIVIGAQTLGVVFKVLGVVLALALGFALSWLWRRFG